jgi:hypothetical protein
LPSASSAILPSAVSSSSARRPWRVDAVRQRSQFPWSDTYGDERALVR